MWLDCPSVANSFLLRSMHRIPIAPSYCIPLAILTMEERRWSCNAVQPSASTLFNTSLGATGRSQVMASDRLLR